MTQRNRGRGSPRRSRGRRKRTQWSQQNILFTQVATAGISFADLTLEPMATSEEGVAKILRLIANFTLSAVATTVAAQRAALGIYVASHEAFLQLAFASPFSGDETTGWYYWTSRVLLHAAAANSPDQWEVDIRTQRLLRGGYKLIGVVENPAQTLVLSLDMDVRTLWEVD